MSDPTLTAPLEASRTSAVSTTDFRNGMALLPGAVTVITTDGPAGPAGFTATAVCSVTDTPPTMLVCMNRSSFAHRFFTENKVLCVNVLAGSQEELSGLFANRNVTMDERFARSPSDRLVTGSPALQGALVNLDGRITAAHDVGTHSVFIVELDQIRVPDTTGAHGGLTYFNRAYHCVGPVAQA
jgi:flavin reductase